MFTYLFTFLFTWKVLRDLNLDLNLESVAEFKFGFEFGLKLNLNWDFEVFFKTNVDYLIVVSGGSSSLGGLIKETRRCFLRCLHASNSSSLLFSIEIGSAIRIVSFSVRHRSHARPPLENG